MKILLTQLSCELGLLLQYKAQWLYGVVIYFILTCVTYWLVQGVNAAIWPEFSAIIMLILLATSLLLSLQTGFWADSQYEALNLLVIYTNVSLRWAIIRLLVVYLIIVVPMGLMSVLLGWMLHAPISQSSMFAVIWGLIAWLMLGLGLIVGALAPMLKFKSSLLMVLVIPLYIPLLLWAAGGIYHYQVGVSNSFEVNLLAGLATLGLVLFPYLLRASIKIGVDN